MITRRQSLKRLVGVAAATLTVPMINRGWFQVFAESATKYSARAIDLVQRSTVVDMLNPFTLLGVRWLPSRATSARPGSPIPRHLLPPTFSALKIPEPM
jgi:hypothetical protein